MYRAVLEYMAGVQPDYEGFFVRPCLPTEWDKIAVERELRGKRYVLEISNREVFVNGSKLDGDFVEYEAGEE